MLISHRHRFIFLKTRKTAGTSIEVLLARFCGPDDVVTPIAPPVEGHVPRNFRTFFSPFPGLFGRHRENPGPVIRNCLNRRRFYNHMSARTISNRVSRSVWEGYFKFCFERNPWDKVVSAYHWATKGLSFRGTFDDFVDLGELPADFDRYTLDGRPCVDFVGRFESLEKDLRSVLTRIGIPSDVELPRTKSGVRADAGHYSAYYNDETRERVRTVFEREIGLLGYEFEQR